MNCEPVVPKRDGPIPDTLGAKYENEPENFVLRSPINAKTVRFEPVPAFALQVTLESETTSVSEQDVFPT
jgi:hypothetical protein